jgi:hypothetical protein
MDESMEAFINKMGIGAEREKFICGEIKKAVGLYCFSYEEKTLHPPTSSMCLHQITITDKRDGQEYPILSYHVMSDSFIITEKMAGLEWACHDMSAKKPPEDPYWDAGSSIPHIITMLENTLLKKIERLTGLKKNNFDCEIEYLKKSHTFLQSCYLATVTDKRNGVKYPPIILTEGFLSNDPAPQITLRKIENLCREIRKKMEEFLCRERKRDEDKLFRAVGMDRGEKEDKQCWHWRFNPHLDPSFFGWEEEKLSEKSDPIRKNQDVRQDWRIKFYKEVFGPLLTEKSDPMPDPVPPTPEKKMKMEAFIKRRASEYMSHKKSFEMKDMCEKGMETFARELSIARQLSNLHRGNLQKDY